MSKAVLISTQPKRCAKILNGENTIDFRKTRPKIDALFKCYIYCTNSGRPLVYGMSWREEKYTQTYGYNRNKAEKIWDVLNGKVIGEFMCDEIFPLLFYGKRVYGWHISDLKIYDEPKELSEFRTICKYGDDYPCHICNKAKRESHNILYCDNTLKRPPQSWCYVEKI